LERQAQNGAAQCSVKWVATNRRGKRQKEGKPKRKTPTTAIETKR